MNYLTKEEKKEPKPQLEILTENAKKSQKDELARRIGFHISEYKKFWESPVRPDDFLAALGSDAVIWLQVAGESVEHIANFAKIIGVELSDLIAPEYFIPKRAFIPHGDGTVTLAAPADGYDDWGRLIPIPEPEPEPEPEEEIEPDPV